MIQKATIDDVRSNNRTLMLRELRRTGPLSRTELCAATGLSSATVSAITASLLDEGRIMQPQAERAPGAGPGRPQVLLQLNPSYASVVVVRITVRHIRLTVVDYAGRDTALREMKDDLRSLEKGAFIATLVQKIESLIEASGTPAGSLAHIIVAAQGATDSTAEMVLWSPILQAHDIDLATPFRRRFHVPVTVMNDCGLMAEALPWIDPERYADRFAVVLVGSGVGMGLHIDGAPFVGLHHSALEFGHANHQPDGALCRCGRKGCVEAYAADYAIWRRARGLADDTDPTKIAPADDEMDAVLAKARGGDEACLDAYRAAGRAIGFGLGRVYALIGSFPIMFTGVGVRAFDILEPAIRAGISASLVDALLGELRFDTYEDQEDLVHKGAAMLALDRLDRDVFAAHGAVRAVAEVSG